MLGRHLGHLIDRRYLLDLDGTVIETELLPLLGRKLGLSEELGELTRLTMQGVIPFEVSFRRRVEMLAAIPISHVRSIVADAPINETIASFISQNRSRVMLVTGNCDVWVQDIAVRLGVEMASSKATCEGDRLTGLSMVLDKGEVAKKLGGQAVAVGDGHNDLPMFLHCKYSIAYGGVHPPAPSLIDVATHAVYSAEALCRLLPLL